jgi:serine/threonine-protein kinase RsbT
MNAGIVPIAESKDVVLCRQTVRRLSESVGLGAVGQTMLVTAASELARNTLIYGGGGDCRWSILTHGAKVGLQLIFTDSGPGIPDLSQAMTAGWTSAGGMGLGLTGAKRLAHEFEIQSTVGKGTRVSITRWK